MRNQNTPLDPLPHLHSCGWINTEGKEPSKPKFFFIDTDTAYLVLYTFANVPPDDEYPPQKKWGGTPKFKESEKWVNIAHQTAGYSCHHYYLHAQFLKPKKEILPLLRELPEIYNDSCISRLCSLETATKYNDLLKKYHLGANEGYIHLEEGFYPIDIQYLNAVTDDKFPENLGDVIEKPKKEKSRKTPREKQSVFEQIRDFHLTHRDFGLAILGPNCD